MSQPTFPPSHSNQAKLQRRRSRAKSAPTARRADPALPQPSSGAPPQEKNKRQALQKSQASQNLPKFSQAPSATLSASPAASSQAPTLPQPSSGAPPQEKNKRQALQKSQGSQNLLGILLASPQLSSGASTQEKKDPALPPPPPLRATTKPALVAIGRLRREPAFRPKLEQDPDELTPWTRALIDRLADAAGHDRTKMPDHIGSMFGSKADADEFIKKLKAHDETPFVAERLEHVKAAQDQLKRASGDAEGASAIRAHLEVEHANLTRDVAYMNALKMGPRKKRRSSAELRQLHKSKDFTSTGGFAWTSAMAKEQAADAAQDILKAGGEGKEAADALKRRGHDPASVIKDQRTRDKVKAYGYTDVDLASTRLYTLAQFDTLNANLEDNNKRVRSLPKAPMQNFLRSSELMNRVQKEKGEEAIDKYKKSTGKKSYPYHKHLEDQELTEMEEEDRVHARFLRRAFRKLPLELMTVERGGMYSRGTAVDRWGGPTPENEKGFISKNITSSSTNRKVARVFAGVDPHVEQLIPEKEPEKKNPEGADDTSAKDKPEDKPDAHMLFTYRAMVRNLEPFSAAPEKKELAEVGINSEYEATMDPGTEFRNIKADFLDAGGRPLSPDEVRKGRGPVIGKVEATALPPRVATGLVGEARLAALNAKYARLVAAGAVGVRVVPATKDGKESRLVARDSAGNELDLE